MTSAVVVPLILLVVALAPGLYEDWKAYRRQTRLPLPPVRSSLVGLLGAAAARPRRRSTRWTGSSGVRSHRSGARLPRAEPGVRRDTPSAPALRSRGGQAAPVARNGHVGDAAPVLCPDRYGPRPGGRSTATGP